ncbi:uncharacterized protein LOC144470442 [Augochlora pura]
MTDYYKLEAAGTDFHQLLYELLPDWFCHHNTEVIYIKKRIGFALYGPKFNESVTTTNSLTLKEYNETELKTINQIYEKIIQCNENNNFITIGIIYNVIYNDEQPLSSNGIVPLPIFKLKLSTYSILYIDSCARVYKSWYDYLENNTLPKCWMLLPKNGIYQCNPFCSVTKCDSIVWLELFKSPAHKIKKTILKITDISSNVIGVGSAIGLGVMSLINPVGPIVAGAGLVGCVASGGWNIGRNIARLKDRKDHKESISPINGDALSAYIGIAGTALTMGTAGGNILLSQAVAKGVSISNGARVAYNSLLLGNLTVGGVGIIYEGLRLIDQYQTQKEVNIVDVMLFSSHVLFFSNAIISVKLAGELLGNSKGTVLEKFKNFLRSNRFEQEYAKTVGDKKSSTASVHTLEIITNASDFLTKFTNIVENPIVQSIFIDGIALVNGITFIDPLIVAVQLLTKCQDQVPTLTSESSSVNIVNGLMTLANKLYGEFSSSQSKSKKQSCNVKKYRNMFNEIAVLEDPTKIFHMLFFAGLKMAQSRTEFLNGMLDAIEFLWNYAKGNLEKNMKQSCSPVKGNSILYKLLSKIIANLFESLDEFVYALRSAFYTYMTNNKLTT